MVPSAKQTAMQSFLKENFGGNLNKVFLAGYLHDIVTADNKTKALVRTVRDLALFRITWPIALVGLFGGMQKVVRSILHDTGSLDAALRRLQSIQGFQRVFAPLVGGLDAAKQRVAALLNVSSGQRVFKFEDIAEGSRQLQVLTRGTYASTDAMQTIIDASAASGNSVVDVSQKVGQFYETLRNGEPVAQVADEMRQMGLIDQQTADSLTSLQRSGAGASAVFSDLTTNLARAKGGAKDAAGDIAAVTAARAAAGQKAQEAFGASFTEKDITNTKNYTDAMVAVTPVIGRLGQFFADLTLGLSTARSWMTKLVAESPAFQAVFEYGAKSIGVLIAAASVFGLTMIPQLIGGIFRLTAVFMTGGVAATTFGIAIRTLAIAGGIGLLLAALATAAGVFMNFRESMSAEAKQARELAAAHGQAEAAMRKQMSTIKTLAEYHEALTAAIQAEMEAQDALAKARAESAERHGVNDIFVRTGLAGPRGKANRESAAANDPLVKEAERAAAAAGKNLKDLTKKGPGSLTSEGEQNKARQDAARVIENEERAFQERLTKGGANHPQLLRERAAVLRSREEQGAVGANVAAGTERRQTELEATRDYADRNMREAIASKDPRTAMAMMKQRDAAIKELATFRLQAPAGTSVRLSAEAEKLRATNPRGAAALDVKAEIARQREAQTEQRSRELQAEADAAEREQRVTKFRQDVEIRQGEARRGGRFGEAVSLRDEAAFGERFESLRGQGFSDKEAKDMALRGTREEIAQSTVTRGFGQVADSLQRIGGGGGFYQGATDPMLQAAKRQEALLEEARNYLKTIAGQDDGVF